MHENTFAQNLKMRKVALLCLLAVLTLKVFSQNKESFGSIKGMILSSDDQPASGATILLTGVGTRTVDASGSFEYRSVPPGDYILEISFIGQETLKKTVSVKAGEATPVSVKLGISSLLLSEVLIVGNKYSITAKKQSSSVARMSLKNLENPQVYNVIDKELIKEQMAIHLDEAFRNVPGAAPAKTGAGIPAFFSRGFTTSDNMRNGMATYFRSSIDLSTVEKVETIKGPASTLFGGVMTSFGGLVNYITKKPYDHFGGEVSYTHGSFDLNRLTADFNAPLSKDQKALFRINMAAQKENSFQDQGQASTFVIAPSFSLRANDRLTLRLDADIHQTRGTASTAWQTGTAINVSSYDQLQLNYKRSLIDNSFAGHQTSANVFAQAEYKISDQWTATTNYTWATGEYNNFYMFTNTFLTDTTVARSVGAFAPDKLGRNQVQQNFTGDFTIGGMRNRLLVGLDFMDQYRNLKYSTVNLDTVNTLGTAKDVRLEQLEIRMGSMSSPLSLSRQRVYGAYISDVLNITDYLLVMASLRVDRFINKGTLNNLTQKTTGNYNQTALSPKLGVVFQPIKDKVALFGNYMNGFRNVANATQPDGSVSSFDPQQANQWEAGVKLDILRNKLSSSVSYYNILVSKTLRPEIINNQTFTVQDGTQRSKGIEAEVTGNPFPGFNFVSGYSYNDNKYIKSAANLVGKRAVGAPRETANLWLSYSLLKGDLKGMGIGAGFLYVSETYLNNINTFTLPAYTILDATVFYNAGQYRISLKANNLTGTNYWVSDGFYARPQKPGNFLAGIAWKF